VGYSCGSRGQDMSFEINMGHQSTESLLLFTERPVSDHKFTCRKHFVDLCHSVSQFSNVINLSGLVCTVIIINM